MSKSMIKRILRQTSPEIWQWHGPHRVSAFHYNELVDKKWYHNTEDDDYIGPYDTEEAANKALYNYCKDLEIENPSPLDKEF